MVTQLKRKPSAEKQLYFWTSDFKNPEDGTIVQEDVTRVLVTRQGFISIKTYLASPTSMKVRYAEQLGEIFIQSSNIFKNYIQDFDVSLMNMAVLQETTERVVRSF